MKLNKHVLCAVSAPSADVLGNILKRLTAKRSRARIVDKIISMGLVSERKELYKKRRRSAAGTAKSRGMVNVTTVNELNQWKGFSGLF